MSESLYDLFNGAVPMWAIGLIIAAIVIVAGWFISKIISALVAKGVNKTGIGKRTKSTGGNIGASLGKAVFWVLWLIFILFGLSHVDLIADRLSFLQSMQNDVAGFIPNFFYAAIVFAIGVLLARVGNNATSAVVEVAQVDNIASRYNFAGAGETGVKTTDRPIAKAAGTIVGALIAITFAAFALDLLKIEWVDQNLVPLLETILKYALKIIGASIVLAIAVFIGRYVSNLLRSTLPALGVDDSLGAIGSLDGERTATVRPSSVIATIAFVAILIAGLSFAVGIIDVDGLSATYRRLLGIGGQIVLGVVIIAAGIFIANVVAKFLKDTTGETIANVIRIVLIVLITFMGLSEMELGDGIVENFFTLAIGAAAVAAGVGGAIAFGMGGREWAGKKLNEWWPSKKTAAPRVTRKK